MLSQVDEFLNKIIILSLSKYATEIEVKKAFSLIYLLNFVI